MRAALSERLPGTRPLRRVLYALGLVALFGYLTDFSWPQVVVLAGIVLLGESVEISGAIPWGDDRHVRLALGLLLLASSSVVFWRGPDPDVVVAAFIAVIGGWVALDALYSLHAGRRPDTSDSDDIDTGEAVLSMQVGHLVAEELKDGPKTVPELADACDMTESRVRDALEYHDRAGTAYQDGDRWVLDESNVGPWAFVRTNTRRVARRIARPFRLFVPG